MNEPGFKRLWTMPRQAMRGGTLAEFSPRGRYLVEQSRARYHRRPDAYVPGTEPRITGELGHIDSFRFITSPPLPDPDFYPAPDVVTMALLERMAARMRAPRPAPHLVITTPNGDDWFRLGYQAAMRSGSAAILMGMDLASGPDWTAVYSWPDLVPQPPRRTMTLLDTERIIKAELKRARRRTRLRQLSAKGAIGRA